MKQVPLSQGLFALVDDEDWEKVMQFKWTASRESRDTKWYAIRRSKKHERPDGKRVKIRMHRWLLGIPTGPEDDRVVDHLNDDSLDNRRANLEIITQEENMRRVESWRRKKPSTECCL